VENSESQTDSNVKVNGSFGDSPALWDFQFVGDGYYTVRAVGEPQNAFLCADEVSDDVELIYGSQSTAAIYDGTLWKISLTATGKMRLCSKALEEQSKALSFVVLDRLYPEDPILYDAVMTTYTKDSVFTDEWGIRCNTRRIEQEADMWCWAACIQMIELKYQENTKTQEELALMMADLLQLDTTASDFDLGAVGADIAELVLIAEAVIQRDLTGRHKTFSEEYLLCRALDIGNMVIFNTQQTEGEHVRVIYDYKKSDSGEIIFCVFDSSHYLWDGTLFHTFDELLNLSGSWEDTVYYEFGNTRYY
ncbi:MAG: hypothetical protein J6D21_00285, partial [Clostridia bacterium]|nr:hypothetical protein [Clostridia bacterium]